VVFTSQRCDCFNYLILSHDKSRRLSVWLLYRIETFQFDARINRAELPVDGTDALIAMLLPTLDLLAKLLNCGNVVGQTLPRQHTQFDLGNIEPARIVLAT
jgi:hypothetical protein